MLASATQSLVVLVVAAALLYPLFAQSRLDERDPVCGGLLGAIFGASALAMMLSGYPLEGGILVTAAAGVLIFAGYIGGPIAAAGTLLIVLAYRIWIGGAVLPIALAALTGFLVAGLVLRRIRPFAMWPEMPDDILKFALGAYLVVQTASATMAVALGMIPGDVTMTVLAFYIAGTLSVFLTWLAIRVSWRHSATMRGNATLHKQQLKLIARHFGIGAFQYDGQRGLHVNDPNFLRLYGLDDSTSPRPDEENVRRIHPDDRDAMLDLIRKTVAGELSGASHDFRAYSSDGTLCYMRAVWEAGTDEATGTRQVTGLFIDMTDIVMTQNEHAATVAHVAAIAENVPGGIYSLTWENNFARDPLYISPKCAEIWGIASDVDFATAYREASKRHPEEVARVFAAIRATITSGKPQPVRLKMTAEDGTVRWIDQRVQAIERDDGTHQIYGVFIDVTEAVAAREEAEKQAAIAFRAQKNESIGQLAGGVAHDFNNLLTVILGNLELLRDDLESDAHKKMIDSAIEAVDHGADLTRCILAFAGRATLRPESLDLNEIAHQAENWMRRALPESIELETSLPSGLWPVFLDPALIESALLNLILNARDAMEGRGKLVIETANVRVDQTLFDIRNKELPPGRYVMLSVRDTGVGIEGEALERIFELFYTTKGPNQGSGVGLSMVHGFVEQSGGILHLDSEPGKGTMFKLFFPASETAPVTDALRRQTHARRSAGKARILLAEDATPVRDVLVGMLKSAGHQVVAAKNGDAALDLFRTDQDFDLLMTDQVMPGSIQGEHLARSIRRSAPNLPVVFLSGNPTDTTGPDDGALRDAIYLVKPVPRVELLNAVVTAMNGRSERR